MNTQYISTYQRPITNPTISQSYTVNFFNTAITTVVTSNPAIASHWVNNIRRNYSNCFSNSSLVVGLGVQWKPTFGPHSPVAATLQLCVDSNCLIFQLCYANFIPASLSLLLDDSRVIFVGVHNERDKSLLEESWALKVRNLVDLAKVEGFGMRSMEDMCSDVLGLHGIVKPAEIGMSDWDTFWLSVDQVQYACVDAYIACSLGLALGYPKNDYHVSNVSNVNDGDVSYLGNSNELCNDSVGDVCVNNDYGNSDKSYGPIAGYSNGDDCHNGEYHNSDNSYVPISSYSNGDDYHNNSYLNSGNSYGPIGGYSNGDDSYNSGYRNSDISYGPIGVGGYSNGDNSHNSGYRNYIG